MTEWALPPDKSYELMMLRRELEKSGEIERFRPFLKGGHWRNFLTKYEESSRIYHRMLRTSYLLQEAIACDKGSDERLEQAYVYLYRAQCNCAYWHGVFGGLYLPHLRSALWENLIKAESNLKSQYQPEIITKHDIDGDGVDEYRIESSDFGITIGSEFGYVEDFELSNPPINLLDTLTRRQEAYHLELTQIDYADEQNETKTIHDTLKVKEDNLDKFLIYDHYSRRGGIEHILLEENSLDNFERGLSKMSLQTRKTGIINNNMNFYLAGSGIAEGLQFIKVFNLDQKDESFNCNYRIESVPEHIKNHLFGSEWCINLRDGHSVESYIEVEGQNLKDNYLDFRGILENVHKIDLVCEWMSLRLSILLTPSAKVFFSPLFTISASEGGVEKVFQGTMMLFAWEMSLHSKLSIAINKSMIQ